MDECKFHKMFMNTKRSLCINSCLDSKGTIIIWSSISWPRSHNLTAQQMEQTIFFLCHFLVQMFTTNCLLSIYHASVWLTMRNSSQLCYRGLWTSFVSDIDYVNRRMKAGCVCVLCISINHQNFKALNKRHLSFAVQTFVEHSNPSSLPSPLLDLRTCYVFQNDNNVGASSNHVYCFIQGRKQNYELKNVQKDLPDQETTVRLRLTYCLRDKNNIFPGSLLASLFFSHTFFFFSDRDYFFLDPITCWNRLIFSYTETLPPRAFPTRGNAEETTHWDHLNSHSLMKWDKQIKKKVHWDFPQHGKNMQKQKAPFLNHIFKAKLKKKK